MGFFETLKIIGSGVVRFLGILPLLVVIGLVCLFVSTGAQYIKATPEGKGYGTLILGFGVVLGILLGCILCSLVM